MNLSSTQKSLITKVINVFESGTPAGKYGIIAIFNDGPGDIRQITYGRSQTTEYGNLPKLVKNYVNANGIYSNKLKPFASKVGIVPLTDDETFKNLLKKAGNEDPVMKTVQDVFFDEAYYKPAMNWATQKGFILPLSALVIYDSFIQSGSILSVIRNTFPETVPADGGNEIEWTTAYVKARHDWLANHPREAVRKTVYRTKCFIEEVARGNWPLTTLPINANGTKVS